MLRYFHPRMGLRTAPAFREINHLLGALAQSVSHVLPPLRLNEEKERFVLEARLPGVAADDLKITVQGKTLYLEGERKAPQLEEGCRHHRQERNFGSFSRAISLPAEVDAGKVSATQVDGILRIVLPKDAAVMPREIKVN